MEKHHSLHTLIDVQARVMGLGGHGLTAIFMEETQKCLHIPRKDVGGSSES